MSPSKIQSPYVYFGGKSAVADLVWRRFGDVRNYVEPFFGSGAVLLRRPKPFDGYETANDLDCMICNFWRAVRAEPEAVAEHASWPVIENDLHARHAWLVNRKPLLVSQIEGDPDYCDVKVAGWWVWGIANWIGGGFCGGDGPWRVVDGHLTRAADGGVSRQLPDLYHPRGISRQTIQACDIGGTRRTVDLREWMRALSDRMRRVRVCCGDWSRVCTQTPTYYLGLTAVFLDPPYSAEANRDKGIYAHDSESVARDAREWAIAAGDNPLMRIALCGYEGEHHMPESWSVVAWKTRGGYGIHADGAGRKNRNRERIWFSPHCLREVDIEPTLF